jgi:hypothetical protein
MADASRNIECPKERRLADDLKKAAEALYVAESDRRNRSKAQTLLKLAQSAWAQHLRSCQICLLK